MGVRFLALKTTNHRALERVQVPVREWLKCGAPVLYLLRLGSNPGLLGCVEGPTPKGWSQLAMISLRLKLVKCWAVGVTKMLQNAMLL
jgi:hypothetical protein